MSTLSLYQHYTTEMLFVLNIQKNWSVYLLSNVWPYLFKHNKILLHCWEMFYWGFLLLERGIRLSFYRSTNNVHSETPCPSRNAIETSFRIYVFILLEGFGAWVETSVIYRFAYHSEEHSLWFGGKSCCWMMASVCDVSNWLSQAACSMTREKHCLTKSAILTNLPMVT